MALTDEQIARLEEGGFPSRLDCLYGVAAVRPQFAVRIQDMTRRELFMAFIDRCVGAFLRWWPLLLFVFLGWLAWR